MSAVGVRPDMGKIGHAGLTAFVCIQIVCVYAGSASVCIQNCLYTDECSMNYWMIDALLFCV